MKILITGAKGQLGSEIAAYLKENHEIIPTSRNDFDIVDKNSTLNFINQKNPDLIIHCAAYTDVEKAEIEIKKAQEVNFLGTKNIVKAAKENNSILIYISTDYVFDGAKTVPYTSKDLPNPINIYGITKLKAEEIVKNWEKSYILRTSWLYGNNDSNFVQKIIKKIKNKEEIFVVDDETGSPTSIAEIAKNILKILDLKYGTYHIACSDFATRYEFALEIAKFYSYEKIYKISSNNLNLNAKRPKYSVLKSDFECENWKIALKDYLKK